MLYAEPRLAWISGLCALLCLSLLAWLFRAALRRFDRLRATHAAMADWRGGYVLVLRSFGRPELYQDTLVDRGPDNWASPPMEESVIGAIEAAVRAEGLRRGLPSRSRGARSLSSAGTLISSLPVPRPG